MMAIKKFILLVLFLSGSIAFGQKTKAVAAKPQAGASVTLTKSTLINARTIRDLITVPKGCKIGSYLLTLKSGGNFHEIQGKGETLSQEAAAAFKHMNANQSFTIENIKGGCKGMKKKYEVLIK